MRLGLLGRVGTVSVRFVAAGRALMCHAAEPLAGAALPQGDSRQ